MSVIVRRHKFEGEVVEGEYEVEVDGKVIGIVRKGPASRGYYNSWQVGRHGFSSRKEGVQYIVNGRVGKEAQS